MIEIILGEEILNGICHKSRNRCNHSLSSRYHSRNLSCPSRNHSRISKALSVIRTNSMIFSLAVIIQKVMNRTLAHYFLRFLPKIHSSSNLLII